MYRFKWIGLAVKLYHYQCSNRLPIMTAHLRGISWLTRRALISNTCGSTDDDLYFRIEIGVLLCLNCVVILYYGICSVLGAYVVYRIAFLHRNSISVMSTVFNSILESGIAKWDLKLFANDVSRNTHWERTWIREQPKAVNKAGSTYVYVYKRPKFL